MTTETAIMIEADASPVGEMTAEEAQKVTDEILKHLDKANKELTAARQKVHLIDQYRGYRALGFKSFNAWAEATLTTHKSQAYRIRAAAAIEAIVKPDGTIGLIPERVLRELNDYRDKPDVARTLYAIAERLADGGAVTSAHTEAVVKTLEEAIATGTLMNDAGEQIPIIQGDGAAGYVARMFESEAYAWLEEKVNGQRDAVKEGMAKITGDGKLKHYILKMPLKVVEIGAANTRGEIPVMLMAEDKLTAVRLMWPEKERTPLKLGLLIDLRLLAEDGITKGGL